MLEHRLLHEYKADIRLLSFTVARWVDKRGTRYFQKKAKKPSHRPRR
ncbi:hypothetical protein [Alteribacillus bidgolensis]|nr:hypothetical protein [Alteribacillus bidgolensis]